MANISRLISLDAFVRRVLAKEGKDNDDYIRYMQIACDGIREFNIHHFDIEVTKVVTVDTTTNTFPYPSDYVRYTMIGTPIDGRWWVYTRDDTMAPLEDDDSTTVQDSLPNVAEYKFATDLSSGGGHNRYYFREDIANSRFQIGGLTADVVVLKYISNGIDSAGSINIPGYARAALESYVRWNIADYDDHAESTTLRLERQYKEAVKRMKIAQRPTLQDLKDTIYAASSQLLRR
jgi:hypothetical protein